MHVHVVESIRVQSVCTRPRPWVQSNIAFIGASTGLHRETWVSGSELILGEQVFRGELDPRFANSACALWGCKRTS